MARGKRRMNRRNEIMAGSRRYIKMVFEIKLGIGKVPISKRRTGKER